MIDFSHHNKNISERGFTVIEGIYTDVEVDDIIASIDETYKSNPTIRKTNDLFAIRQFLKRVPDVKQTIFNDSLITIIDGLFDKGYFVVKSIYFDKPEESNWFAAWHQDLTISVDKKIELRGYNSWTNKQNQFAVQPPIEILEDNFTIRIHLDKTDENNGALKVVAGSHLKGIHRAENIDWSQEKETICEVAEGGVMIMRPLLMHASERTTNEERRRVIHIEFSNTGLPKEIDWAELDRIV
jgi:ectoine hydroxylase-related dioxygenase (phytanoyl-CoA dioxygenase family)